MRLGVKMAMDMIALLVSGGKDSIYHSLYDEQDI